MPMGIDSHIICHYVVSQRNCNILGQCGDSFSFGNGTCRSRIMRRKDREGVWGGAV